MAEPMLILGQRDLERALTVFDAYMASGIPYLRAAAALMRCSFSRMLGRIDGAEADCRASLAAFRTLGDSWGVASALIQLAELAQVRGDFPTTVAALLDAGASGRDLGTWGDLSFIDGMLAAVRLRMGDLAQAGADLEQAEQAQAELGGRLNDAGAWLSLVRAELHWQSGDMAAAGSSCERVLAWLDQKESPWWDGMRAQLEARLAMVVLRGGEQARSRELLAAALRTAVAWVERPALAAVVDAIAAFVLQAGEPAGPGGSPESAVLAATLLGAAHTIRGAFDEGSLDAPGARSAARGLLGEAGFDAAYKRGRALDRDQGIAVAQGAVADPPAV